MEEINPKDIAQDIAKRVTALRLQRAWTREVLAEHAGVNVYTLKHFERTGQINFSLRFCPTTSQKHLVALSPAVALQGKGVEISWSLRRCFTSAPSAPAKPC